MPTGTRSSARLAERAKLLAQQQMDVDSYDLSVELPAETKRQYAIIRDDELKYPITPGDWVQFYCEYFDYISKNIGTCLSKIPGLSHVTIGVLTSKNLDKGGFDDEFDNFGNLNFNLGIYTSLFRQFRDGTNKVNGCTNLNLLLSYIGDAVLRLADHHNSISPDDLIAFYRKIIVVLELAVYPEVFLHYMTGDSTGHAHKIDFTFHDISKRRWYIGIWLRKQEYLGVLSSNGKNYYKKYDSGLRLFVRNYMRRLITYMRTYKDEAYYPLGYEKPYGYVNVVDRAPLPYKGIYRGAPQQDNYYICRDDWNKLPNFLLPDEARWTSFAKNFRHPSKWHNPPPKWWIDRTLKLLEGFDWWNSGTDEEEAYKKKLDGTKTLAKWKALNSILPQQYKAYESAWEYDNEDFGEAGMNYGGGSQTPTNSKLNKKKKFKIFQDKDIALDKKICEELKNKLFNFFELNIVAANDEYNEGHLRNDNYIDNLNNSIIYYCQKNKIRIHKTSSLRPASEPSRLVRPASARLVRPASEPSRLVRPASARLLKTKTNSKNNRGSSSASSADTVNASS